jgi:hypothetical protein
MLPPKNKRHGAISHAVSDFVVTPRLVFELNLMTLGDLPSVFYRVFLLLYEEGTGDNHEQNEKNQDHAGRRKSTTNTSAASTCTKCHRTSPLPDGL